MIIGQVKNIVVGTPCGDNEKAQKDACTAAMLVQSVAAGLRVGYGPAQGTYTEMGQNALVAATIEQKADALLLIDSDQTLPPTTLLRLLARNKPVVGCVYRSRQAPHAFMGRLLNGASATGTERGLQEMDYIPSGVMLIRASVLRAMDYPWFFNSYGKKPADFVGNDVNFCRKARAATSVWCDFDLSREIGHIADRVLGWDL